MELRFGIWTLGYMPVVQTMKIPKDCYRFVQRSGKYQVSTYVQIRPRPAPLIPGQFYLWHSPFLCAIRVLFFFFSPLSLPLLLVSACFVLHGAAANYGDSRHHDRHGSIVLASPRRLESMRTPPAAFWVGLIAVAPVDATYACTPGASMPVLATQST